MDFKVSPVKAPIELADLERIDVRVGTILSVEDVPGSDKLVKLTVAFGDHERTILAGMKQERENPKEIQGKQALFVVNLPPKRMMGHISEGMLFDIEAKIVRSQILAAGPGIPFSLLCSSQPGCLYALDAATSLSPGAWTPLGTNMALGASLSLTDNNAPTFNQRFYRVRTVTP